MAAPCRSLGVSLLLLLPVVAGAQIRQFPPIAPPLSPNAPRAPQQQSAPARQPGQPAPGQSAAPPNQAAPASQPPARALPLPSSPTVFGGLSLNNVSLIEVIDLLARQLKITYILDPRVKGSVILNTYGEIKDVDTRSLLDIILRMNGAGFGATGQYLSHRAAG